MKSYGIIIFFLLLLSFPASIMFSKELENSRPEGSALIKEPRRTGPMPTQEYIKKVNLVAEGVGVGYEIGFWQPSVAMGIRVSVPLGKKKHVGMQFRVFMPMCELEGRFDPVLNFGIEWFYRTPVFLGIVRIYVGGGLWAGIRPRTFSDDQKDEALFDKKYARFGFAGGGKFGFEFFVKPKKSYFIEIGGQGPGHALKKDMGAHVMAGSVWYFGG